MQPANTPDPARDVGPPPARGASGTFASPSPPPSQPQAPPTGLGSASPLLTPPHPSRLLATLNSRDQTGSSRRVTPPPPSPGNSTEYTLTPFVPPAQSQLGTAAFRMVPGPSRRPSCVRLIRELLRGQKKRGEKETYLC